MIGFRTLFNLLAVCCFYAFLPSRAFGVGVDGCWPDGTPASLTLSDQESLDAWPNLVNSRDQTDASRKIRFLIRLVTKLGCKSERIKILENDAIPAVQSSVLKRFSLIRDSLKSSSRLHSNHRERNQVDALEKEAGFEAGRLTSLIDWKKYSGVEQSYVSERSRSCTAVDLRKLSLARTRNQDGVGWCYAYAAADLLSGKLGQEISAVGVANAFNAKVGADDPTGLEKKLSKTVAGISEGGGIGEALNQALQGGLCREADLPSNNLQFALQKPMLESGYLGAIAVFNNADIRDIYLNNPKSSDSVELQSFYHNLISTFFPQVAFEDLSAALERWQKSGKENGAYQELLSLSCKDPIPNPGLSFVTRTFQSRRRHAFGEIDDTLAKGDLVGISYDGRVLLDHF